MSKKILSNKSVAYLNTNVQVSRFLIFSNFCILKVILHVWSLKNSCTALTAVVINSDSHVGHSLSPTCQHHRCRTMKCYSTCAAITIIKQSHIWPFLDGLYLWIFASFVFFGFSINTQCLFWATHIEGNLPETYLSYLCQRLTKSK